MVILFQFVKKIYHLYC